MHPAFAQTDHRPWPLPAKPWDWRQAWVDLAFIHFAADPAELRRLIPSGLELELFEGNAWVGIIPFRMEHVTKRGWPAPSVFCDFPEINVRTYVTDGRKPGVWFLSLAAPNRLAVWFARNFFHLPYHHARIVTADHGGVCHCEVRRGAQEFVVDCEPGEPAPSQSGTFAHWSTERYCLYSMAADGRLFRAEVQHPKWPLQKARLKIQTNTLADARLGPMHPTISFSRKVEVVLWSPEQIN